ncbi:hypothetical protein O181_010080 [Austropuccinia psidii MF-1]|uniref:Uncharacterized protein n=1 Tax=Austropuccinia psidii MF-1 TaxID=1389203 RepID=A0A9Q3GKJ0_9BASI|nr:hypothetical protein [Austropuccinia psidii MF-1]
MKDNKILKNFNSRSSKCPYCFVGKKPCLFPGGPLSTVKRYLWSDKDGPFGKELSVSEAPMPDGTSGYSSLTGSRKREVSRWTNFGGPIPTGGMQIHFSLEVPISRINNQVVVKIISKISYSPTNPDSEGSDKLDCGEVEMINPMVGHPSSSSPTQPLSKKFHNHLIPSTPRSFQPVLYPLPSSVPPPSP